VNDITNNLRVKREDTSSMGSTGGSAGDYSERRRIEISGRELHDFDEQGHGELRSPSGKIGRTFTGAVA
jgi:hypothetical protein